MSVLQTLLLDGESGEIGKAPVRVGKRSGVSEEKNTAALKSHSEAERRRRERINAHLTTLRGLVPSTEKMDKATLLAEVISQVKQLKKTSTESSKSLLVPMDDDEVKVEPQKKGDGTFSLRASLCCDYSPELISELRQALQALRLNIVDAEISTLGGRVKNVFVFSSEKDRDMNTDNVEECQLLVKSVYRALSCILDKVSSVAEYSPRTTMLQNKRQRTSFLDSSSSSSRE
ncbi:hypothetical protein U1Q18_009323 [Sarracenia purpurea var. burkii]